jgi:hypothetical protein
MTCAVLEMQPIQDLPHVIADGRLTQVEGFAHLLIGQALGDQDEDLPLAGGQVGGRVFHRYFDVLCQAGEFIEQSDGQLGRQRRPTVLHLGEEANRRSG